MSLSIQKLAAVASLLLVACSGAAVSNGASFNSAAADDGEVDLTQAPPLANAGADQQVARGAIVTLDGRRSFQSNGQDFTLFWSQVDGNNEVTLSNPAAALTQFVAPSEVDTLTFQLTASSESGLSTVDTAVVNVSAAPGPEPTAPIIFSSGDVRAEPNSNIDLSATTLAGTLEGSFSWSQVAGPLISATTASNGDLSATVPVSGFVIFAVDGVGQGLRSAPDFVIVAIVSATAAPAAGASNSLDPNQPVGSAAVGPQAANLNATQTLPGASVTLDDPQETTASSWAQLSGPAVTNLTETAAGGISFDAPNTVGTLSFAFYVIDPNSDELAGPPDLITVDVGDMALAAATVNPGPDRNTHPGNTIILDGSQSSAGFGYLWQAASSEVGSASGLLAPTSAMTPLVAPTALGRYLYSLALTDSNGETTVPASTLVTVEPDSINLAPQISIAVNGPTASVYQLTATIVDPENDVPLTGESWSATLPGDGSFTAPHQASTSFTLTAGSTIVSFHACDSLGACTTATVSLP